jgi:hypothetical protein
VTWKALPVYESQKGILATFTTLACILVLAFLFYSRHRFAASMLRLDPTLARGLGWLPFLFVLLATVFGFAYFSTLQESLSANPRDPDYVRGVLDQTPLQSIPSGLGLMVCYILTFVTAETALLVMALREYVQDVLGLSDQAIIRKIAGIKQPPDPETSLFCSRCGKALVNGVCGDCRSPTQASAPP